VETSVNASDLKIVIESDTTSERVGSSAAHGTPDNLNLRSFINMTTTAKKTPVAPESSVSLVDAILASRESPSPELQAKQLRLLRILGVRGNQPLGGDSPGERPGDADAGKH
jgi:hypothetical protein